MEARGFPEYSVVEENTLPTQKATELAVIDFSNQLMVILTQRRRIGSIHQVRCSFSEQGDVFVDAQPLLGERQEAAAEVAVQRIARAFFNKGMTSATRPLMLSISLSSYEKSNVLAVISFVQDSIQR